MTPTDCKYAVAARARGRAGRDARGERGVEGARGEVRAEKTVAMPLRPGQLPLITSSDLLQNGLVGVHGAVHAAAAGHPDHDRRAAWHHAVLLAAAERAVRL